MRVLYNFTCRDCKDTFEKYTEYTQLAECPSCGGQADKIITAPTIKLEGITGAFPGAYAQFEKKHREKLAQERKRSDPTE
jgi:putative FmdB family regulatory protein